MKSVSNLSVAPRVPLPRVPLSRFKLSPHQQKVLGTLGIVGLGVLVGLGGDALAGAAVVTKLSAFCTTWVKPIYLGVLGIAVLVVAYKGGLEVVQDEGQGGRKIGLALIGGAVGIVLPTAILLAIGTTGFTC